MISNSAYSCCDDMDYRLFPLGATKKGVILVEFDLARTCKPKQGYFNFYIKGKINLVLSIEDSLVLIENIATINLEDCTERNKDFYSNTKYEGLLDEYYIEALNKAEKLNAFSPANTSYIIFNDSSNTILTEEYDTTTFEDVYKLIYKNLIIPLETIHVSSSELNKIAETRIYETKDYEITILRVKTHYIPHEITKRNKTRFKTIKTAFWKEEAHHHGIAKDFLFYSKKQK